MPLSPLRPSSKESWSTMPILGKIYKLLHISCFLKIFVLLELETLKEKAPLASEAEKDNKRTESLRMEMFL